jgi:hypothetical protein
VRKHQLPNKAGAGSDAIELLSHGHRPRRDVPDVCRSACNMGTLPTRLRKAVLTFGCYAVPALALTALLITSLVSSRDRPAPRFSVHFTGEISPGLHLNPFGHFILSNEWNRTLEWSRDAVEAPQDPDIVWSASADSQFLFGRLRPGASTDFRALVPHTKGVPFRVIIGYNSPPRPLDRIRVRLPDSLTIVDRLWPRPNLRRTFTSEWFNATADYSR